MSCTWVYGGYREVSLWLRVCREARECGGYVCKWYARYLEWYRRLTV